MGQSRIVQQAMRQMDAVDTAADDQHLEHYRVFSGLLHTLPRASPSA